MARPRRQFSDEFKAEVVALVKQGNKSFAAICRDLDLTPSAVGRWVDAAQHSEPNRVTGALSDDEKSELVRLRREVQQLRTEREILKKATAFFAKETS
jgi:transposase